MRLIITNISPKSTAIDIQAILREFGTVENIYFISIQLSQIETQTAIVQMANKDEALNVTQFLNGDIVQGFPLIIKPLEDDIVKPLENDFSVPLTDIHPTPDDPDPTSGEIAA